jgi:NADH dehydrogenase FAD-containing subunit
LIRLLLVGGGHAAMPLLVSAGRLVERGVAVTLLNDSPRLYYSGMAPEYLGGVYAREQATLDLLAWCERTGVTFAAGRAVALDVRGHHVTTAQGDVHAFDLAVFDVGARAPGAAHAEGAIKAKPLHRIEALEAFVSEALAAGQGTRRLAVVGGGAAGVEVALNVTARALARRPDALAVVLREPGGHLLDAFPRRIRTRALRALSARGVEVRLGHRAEGTDARGVRLHGGEHVPADAVLWATGSEGPPLFREAGLRVDGRGFACVGPTLQVMEAPHLFVAGDAAAVDGHEGLERVGVHAVRQGPVLRDNVFAAVAALQAGRRPDTAALRPFRPPPVAPLIHSTGGPTGWLRLGPLSLTGKSMLRLKHLADRRWMRRYHLDPAAFARLADARAAADGRLLLPSPRTAPAP